MDVKDVVEYLEDIKMDIRLSNESNEITFLEEKIVALEIAIKEIGSVG